MIDRVNDEREISIGEMFWYILSKWKFICVGIIAGAIILFGYQFIRAKDSNEINEVETQDKQIELAAVAYERYAEEYSKLDYSYIMTLDATKVDRVLIQYRVDTDYVIDYNGITGLDYTNDIFKVYDTALRTQEFKNKVIELGIDNLDEQDIDELLFVSYSNGIMEISVYGDNINCKKIADVVKAEIASSYENVSSNIGEHEISLIQEYKTKVYAQSLVNAQISKRNVVYSKKDLYDTMVAKMSEEQKTVLDKYVREIDAEYFNAVVADAEETTKDNVLVKMVVIGALLGALFCVAICVCNFAYGNKMHSINEIEQGLNICLLGKAVDKSYGAIDSFFANKRINCVSKVTIDEQLQFFITTTIAKCSKESIERICILDDANINQETIEKISTEMNKSGISVEICDNISRNSKSLDKAIEFKNVVFIGRLDTTKKSVMDEQISICNKVDVNIVGMLIVV